MKRLPFVLIISGLTAILFLGVFWTVPVQAHGSRHFTLDVAMIGGTNGVNLPDPVPGAVPGRGVVVIVSGNIYKGRTLPRGESDFDPNEPGGIGTWRCHFASLGAIDAPLALVGAVTYFFQLEPTKYDSRESMIIVRGLNSHTAPLPLGTSVPRWLAVVGGTGKFAGVSGEVREEVIGTNFSPLAPPMQEISRNLRFHFRLRNVKDNRSFFSRLKEILEHDDD